MHKTLFSSILSIGLVSLSISCTKVEAVDSVFYGGTIYTLNEKNPQAEAIAVRGNRIVFVGLRRDAISLMDSKTKMIDLKGKILTPGFIEGHGHLMDVGYNEMNLNLAGLSSFDEVIQKVKEAAAKAEPGQWIIGKGWHQDKWIEKPEKMINGFPVHHKLSEVSPDHPVYLEHASGHAALANAKAMQIAGVLSIRKEPLKAPFVEGGAIIRDSNGNPTGLFNENALNLIYSQIPPQDDRRALQLALEACLRNGITSFHDAGTTRKHIELFKSFKDAGQLTISLYVMVTGFDRQLVHEYLRTGPQIDSQGVLTIRSIKLNCDGALGSRGAWLLDPYSDQPGTNGMTTLPMDTVLETSRLALQYGFQVCSHAIGDKANHEILNRYETAFKENPSKSNDHRFRIEHAQHLHPNDIPRFGALGVIPAMQAIHMSSDRPWAIHRLGEKRIKEGAYMWQSLLKSGARIVNGTDAPVEPLNPVACFYAAVTRKTLQGNPEGGYEPEEKMSRKQALKSYTLDAAYGAFEENIKGSIEVGKLADFTVFSKDLMTIAEDEILSTEVSMTVVGGKVMFKK
jgi:predicted amidohydrolase YtcJ